MTACEDVIPLSKTLRQQLRDEVRRTGVTATMLLKNEPKAPPGLTSSLVNRWIGGIVKEAPVAHIDFVRARWAALPDDAAIVSDLPKRGRRHHGADEAWIDVTDDMARQLRAEFARTGLDQRSVIGRDAPAGLKPRIVQAWLYRETATTRETHWTYVAKRLAGTPARRSISVADRIGSPESRFPEN